MEELVDENKAVLVEERGRDVFGVRDETGGRQIQIGRDFRAVGKRELRLAGGEHGVRLDFGRELDGDLEGCELAERRSGDGCRCAFENRGAA